MKAAIFIISMCLCFGLIPLTSLAAPAMPPVKDGQGTIMQFSLEDRNMLINDKSFALDDRLQVITKQNIAAGDRILQKGQAIEYWLSDSKATKQDVPTIKKIRILSDVKMNY